MADKDKHNKSQGRISDKERFRYIGFEVFPGKPRDLFKSEAEKKKYVATIVEKRSEGDMLRHHCTLTEERVTFKEKLIMAVACAVILFSLFIPWYSVYNEIVDEDTNVSTALAGDSMSVKPDSLMAADSLAVDSMGLQLAATIPDDIAPGAAEGEGAEAEAEMPAVTDNEGTTVTQQQTSTEEIIHGMQARKRVHKEYQRLSGIGALLALGSIGSYIFSSGFVLILTALIFLVYTLLCIGLPVFTLYNIFGVKGQEDEKALRLKKYLKWNWIPVLMFLAAIILSFFGAEYAVEAVGTFTSIGESYGPAAFLDSISWGIITTIGGFILLAVKGIEI